MTPTAFVQAYYEALRNAEPLGPFFASAQGNETPIVKFGIGERLVGAETIREGLAEQTDTTADWTVESRALRCVDRDCHAWFSDDVSLTWTDVRRDRRVEFETRWSGTMERVDGDGRPPASGSADHVDTGDRPWRFVMMHVSAPAET